MNIYCYCSGIAAERHLRLVCLTGLKGLLIQALFFFRHSWCSKMWHWCTKVAGFNFVWRTGLVFMHERVFIVLLEYIKKQKSRFAQHCVLIADKGNHLLQTVAPSNQGQAGCVSPGCSRSNTYVLSLTFTAYCRKLFLLQKLSLLNNSLNRIAPAAIATTWAGLKRRLRNVAVDQRCFAHLTFLNQTNKQRFSFDVFMRELKVTPVVYLAYFRLRGPVNVPHFWPGTGLLR